MMRKKFLVGLLLAVSTVSFAVETYAIQVKVKTNSKQVSALGFSVQGKKYGMLGKSYENKNVPPGVYTFGFRAGKDVACKTASGKKKVTLKKNTTAILKYNGTKCEMRLIPSK
ncbi:MAG: hypothetical protein H0W64_09615 [Gammaproteobacteria bacterium]|nr:hypothetical protein [Gammaproteobacteria bacterium]